VRVCDAAGGCGEGAFDVTVAAVAPPNLPPVASVTGPTQVALGTSVTFDASASTDPEGQPLAFAWDVDGDGQLDDGTGPTVSFVADVAGTRSVVVRVTDDRGDTSVATAVLVVTAPTTPDPAPPDPTRPDPAPAATTPTLDAIGDRRVAVGQLLSISTTVRDASTAPSYVATVDWGDGNGPRPASVTPGVTGAADYVDAVAFVGTVDLRTTYSAVGTYRVTVQVCGSSCAETSFTVEVTAAELAPPEPTPILPATGNDVSIPVRLGGWLAVAGVALLLVSRRRRSNVS
jgi:hypothetical protein